MLGKIFGTLRSRALTLVCMAVLALNAVCVSAFAQQQTQTIAVPSGATLDWTSVTESVFTSLAGAAIAGIGIALGACVLVMGVKFFRRAAS